MNVTVCKNYKIIRKVGSGAFGEIFLALNKATGEECALKVEDATTKYP